MEVPLDGWYELRVYDGDTRDPIVERAIRIQTWLTAHVVPENPATAALLAVVVLTAVGLGAVMITRARTARHTGEDAAVENA